MHYITVIYVIYELLLWPPIFLELLHFFACILFFSLLSLQYGNDNTLSSWGLKSCSAFFFSSLLRVCSNVRASQPNQFSKLEAFYFHVCLCLLVWEKVLTSFSKLHSSWYLSGTFQSNVICIRVDSLILGTSFVGLALLIRVCASLMGYYCYFCSFNCQLDYCLHHVLFRFHYFLN